MISIIKESRKSKLTQLWRHAVLASLLLGVSPIAAQAASPEDMTGEIAESGYVHESQSKPLGKRERKEAMQSITADYKPWMKVALQGRLQTDILPISPTLRISMEQGKPIIVSVRAPLVGEVARLEMDQESILIVNKMKKRYCRLWPDRCATFLDYGQNMLLGRVVLAGSGVLSKSNVGKADFYAVNVGPEDMEQLAHPGDQLQEWIIAPESLWDSINYEYLVDSEGRIRQFTVSALKSLLDRLAGIEAESSESSTATMPVATADIEWGRDGETNTLLNVMAGKRKYSARLSLEAPEYGARLIAPIELTEKYKESPLREVIKF